MLNAKEIVERIRSNPPVFETHKKLIVKTQEPKDPRLLEVLELLRSDPGLAAKLGLE